MIPEPRGNRGNLNLDKEVSKVETRTQVAALKKQIILLYTRAQLQGKVGEQIPEYNSLVISIRELDNLPLKLKALEILICLQVQFGSQVDKQISQAIRTYCKYLGLDLGEARKTINEVVSWFESWIVSKWPLDI